MWEPVAGKYGRTRDGRKVGPMVWGDNPSYPWTVADPRTDAPGIGAPEWAANGWYGFCRGGNPSDLVAEWVDDVGPVRQRTVMEIVPGTYDHVTVEMVRNDPHGPRVGVGIGSRNQYALMNADELDAAARVLTQLAEALRHG